MAMDEGEIKPGDVVRVKGPERFLVEFANKIRDRDAIVEWVGPDAHGMNVGRCGVIFQKRNGRGREFRETMRTSHLERMRPAEPAMD